MPYTMWVNGAYGEGSPGTVIEVHEVAQKLTARTGEFARLLTLEGGKPEAKLWWYPYAEK